MGLEMNMETFVQVEYGVLNGIILLTAAVLCYKWLKERRSLRQQSKDGLLNPSVSSHNSSK